MDEPNPSGTQIFGFVDKVGLFALVTGTERAAVVVFVCSEGFCQSKTLAAEWNQARIRDANVRSLVVASKEWLARLHAALRAADVGIGTGNGPAKRRRGRVWRPAATDERVVAAVDGFND